MGSIFITLITALLTFFGINTAAELRKQMKSQVAADMPGLVRDEVSKQFESNHIRDVAESEIRKEAGRQIRQLVEMEVSKAVALEIKRQKPVIQLAVNDEIVHHLSADEASALTDYLKSIGHQSIRFFIDTNHDSDQYLNELAKVFVKAGWSLQGEGNPNQLISATGSILYVGKLSVNVDIPDGQDIAQKVVNALKKAGLPISFEGTNRVTMRGGTPCFTLQLQETKDKNVSSLSSKN